MSEFDRSADKDLGPAVDESEHATFSPPQPWDRSADRRTVVLLFMSVLVVYLLTAAYDGMQLNDTRETAVTAWRVATEGTFAVPPDWAEDMRWAKPGTDGRYFVDRFPGVIAVGVPFYVVADVLGQADPPGHALFLNYVPAGIAAATLTALAIAALYAVFRRIVDRRLAVGGTLVAAFGTAMWSVSADALWTHGPAALWLSLGMLAMSRGRHAAAGGAFALAVLTRPQTAVAPAVLGVWRTLTARSIRPMLVVGVTSMLGVVLLSIYSQATFGTWIPIAGYSPARIENLTTGAGPGFLENLVNTLAHRQRGVLLYTPFLMVLIPFLPRGWRGAPDWVRAAAVSGALYLVVQLRANHWDGGANYFGSRLTIETLVLAAPLLLRTYQQAIAGERVLRMVFALLVGMSILLHAVGATVLRVDAAGRETWDEMLVEVCEVHPDIDECRDG